MPVSPSFEPFLEGMDREVLDQSPDVIYGVDAGMVLGYVNEAWLCSARESAPPDFSERWSLGSRITDAITVPELVTFYRRTFDRAREEGGCGLDYECSTPERYRRFRMHIASLAEGRAFLLTSTLVESVPAREKGRIPRAFEPAVYRRPDGIVTQCAGCRRSATAAGRRWDWVPELVGPNEEKISHGLCPVCLEVYSAE